MKVCFVPWPSRGRNIGTYPLLVFFKSHILLPHVQMLPRCCVEPSIQPAVHKDQTHVLKISAVGYTLPLFLNPTIYVHIHAFQYIHKHLIFSFGFYGFRPQDDFS